MRALEVLGFESTAAHRDRRSQELVTVLAGWNCMDLSDAVCFNLVTTDRWHEKCVTFSAVPLLCCGQPANFREGVSQQSPAD